MSKIDYEILEEIGKGGKGVVFRGIDLINKREIAIKKSRSSPNTQKEIKNHLLLNHLDYVPILYDYFDESENNIKFTYMVQQLIPGDGLHVTWKKIRTGILCG